MSEFFNDIAVLMPAILSGLKVTLQIFALTLIISIPLGLPFALGSNSKIFPIRWLCKAYICVFRGTPLMLQLFFFYFFLPIAFNINIFDRFTTSVLTFGLNYAAYFAEIYRAGIESIDHGQYEASWSLGIGKWRTMFGIIIPQTIKRILPPVSNEVITLVKDTSLVCALGVGEMFKAAEGAVNRTGSATAYLVAAIIYLAITLGLTAVSRYLEKRTSVHEAREG